MALPLNIDDLVNARTLESARIEFKKGWNPFNILRTVCAFSNDIDELGGGYILIGIEEAEGVPILPPHGVEQREIDQIQREFFKLCKDNIEPNVFPPIEVVEFQGKFIIVIWVTTGEQRPYYASNSPARGAEKVIFVRHGSVTKEADENQERQIREIAVFKHFDDRINQKASINDLDLGLIQSYLQEIKSGLYEESLKLSLVEIAIKMQIARGPRENIRPLNVGLLMFCRKPHDFFEGCKTNLIEFEDESGTKYTEKVFLGPVHLQIRDILSYFQTNIIKRYGKKARAKAETDFFYNYPYQALEEIVVNSMYHRSYEEPRPNEIRIYKNSKKGIDKFVDSRRIEIRSYPGPLPPIDNNALQQYKFTSRNYRNIKLGDWLKNIRLAEKYATGVPTILGSLESNGSPKPLFWTDEAKSEFLVVMKVHEATPHEDSDLSELGIININDEQLRMLELLKGEPMEINDLAEKAVGDFEKNIHFLKKNEFVSTKEIKETILVFITAKGLEALRHSF